MKFELRKEELPADDSVQQVRGLLRENRCLEKNSKKVQYPEFQSGDLESKLAQSRPTVTFGLLHCGRSRETQGEDECAQEAQL